MYTKKILNIESNDASKFDLRRFSNTFETLGSLNEIFKLDEERGDLSPFFCPFYTFLTL